MMRRRYFCKFCCRAIALCGVILCGMLLSGCKGERPQKEEGEKEPVEIGMVVDNFVMERWQKDRDIFVSSARELGADVNVQNANGSAEEQKKLIEYFIKKNVDVIVVVPVESEPLLDVIEKARKQKIKVIAYDRLVVGARLDLYISFDNKKVGTLMGEALGEVLCAGDKVLMLCGPISDYNVSRVEEGFVEVMEEKGIRIADKVYAKEWKPEEASDYIRNNKEIVAGVQGIMCGNDSMAEQVISALAEQRLAGDVYVTGQDADLTACQHIVEGTQYMTVYKPIEKIAEQAAKAAVSLAEGETLEPDEWVSLDKERIPYICIEPAGVTLSNIKETIIDSGFHLKEDVYLNRPQLME